MRMTSQSAAVNPAYLFFEWLGGLHLYEANRWKVNNNVQR